jgi:hypothetical protein
MDISTLGNGTYEPTWHKIPNTEVELLIQPLKPGEKRKIAQKAVKYETRGRSVSVRHDAIKHRQLTLHATVKDWKNIKHDGAEFPCNEANREFLDDSWEEFAEFWWSVDEDQSDLEAMLEEESEKNS